MTNNKNNDEIKSTHPEAFEDIKVSDSVPNSYKELLELQKFDLEIIEEPILRDDVDPEKTKFISLCNKTFKSVIQLLYKLKSGPGEDMFIATMLIHRVYHFNKNCLENAKENPNLSEIQIQQLASSNAKLKCLIQILSPEDEDPDEDEWIKFNTIN